MALPNADTTMLAVAVVLLGATMAGQEVARNTVPAVVYSVNPEYTSEAREAKIEGTVIIDMVVGTDGTVGDDVKVVRSLDTKYGLDDQAVKAARQWRFKPATHDGEPIPAHVTIELTFRLAAGVSDHVWSIEEIVGLLG
jgi:TonB family protein